jgi:L-methionine (R)-S-oxide reductase
MHINPERSTRPDYDLLVRQVVSVLEGERDLTANAAQFSALVYDTLADLNWAGFYLTVPAKSGEGQDLLVGPFQGKPACARIPFGRGVCGTTAVERKTIVVPDVHAFPGSHRLRFGVEFGNRAPGRQGRQAGGRVRYRQPVARPLFG